MFLFSSMYYNQERMKANTNPEELSMQQAIDEAEKILPGVRAPEGDYNDPRWQSIIAVGEYIETNPHEVWQFILKWGKYPDSDIRMAVSTCLLEHLLEYHFKEYFPLVKIECKNSKLFADTFQSCSAFGQTEEPDNFADFKALQDELD
jgi:hypothetical protein